jgi:predicted metal-dependent HD superfamily phosphohydrolase
LQTTPAPITHNSIRELIAELEGADGADGADGDSKGADKDAKGAISQHCLEELLEYYAQPHRRYHTLSHLCAMFRDFYDGYDLWENPSQVRAAILYHDIIYRVAADVKSGENEYLSAKLAVKRLTQMGFGALFIDRVEQMIRATADHKVPLHAPLDLPLFLDMDMAILGSAPSQYKKYRDAVRAEYSIYPDQSFGKGRVELFLKPTLKQNAIFYTPYFKQRFERRARDNMREEIQFWESGLQPKNLQSYKPK